MTETGEATWIERAQRGDRAAFDRLISAYQDPVYRLAWRFRGDPEEARELAQETFIRAWLKLDTFRLGEPFRPWLMQVATRVCLNAAARRAPRVRSLEPETDDERPLEPAGDPADDPARQVTGRALEQAVRQALAELPAPYRLVMLLYHTQHQSYPEIAAALGLPLGTVKTHLHRARARLREILAERLPDEFGDEA